MATDYAELVPHAIAQEIIGAVTEEQSSLMQLANVQPMPSGVETVPVISSAPAAGFVDPAYGGLKPGSAVDFAPLPLTAGEVGVVLGLPNAYIDDNTLPIWESVRNEISKSFTRTFELAALYGTDAPADWPAGGLTAAANATAVTGADAIAAVDAAMAELEGDGISPDGILGGAALRAALRAQMVAALLPFESAPASIFGVPVRFSSAWNDATGIALVGGWENVIVGVREDITYDMSDSAVITDDTGAVTFNSFQQDSQLMRGYWRVALAEAHPIGVGGSAVKPLALATVSP